jgi:hypothetical protein
MLQPSSLSNELKKGHQNLVRLSLSRLPFPNYLFEINTEQILVYVSYRFMYTFSIHTVFRQKWLPVKS